MNKFNIFVGTVLAFLLAACSKDEPEPLIFMQISSITNESGSQSKQISYDSYGKVTSYKCAYPGESVVVDYEYVSDNLIKIYTKDVVSDLNGDIIRTYTDELHLEKGQAVSCDGIFSMTQQDKYLSRKKYRHEFIYTRDNRLNVIKCTEWNKPNEELTEDKPKTWENIYYWECGNITKIEDYLGYSYPEFTYTYKYTDIADIQNVVPIRMGRYQYIPLQLKGIFGLMPVNLIKEENIDHSHNGNYTLTYQYDITDQRITKYSETSEKGITNTFSVQWTK